MQQDKVLSTDLALNVLDKTLKRNCRVQIYNQKVLRASGPRTKYLVRFFVVQ